MYYITLDVKGKGLCPAEGYYNLTVTGKYHTYRDFYYEFN